MKKLKILKKTIILVLLLFVGVSFGGCGYVNATLKSNSDGSVEESVSIILDSESLLSDGYSTNDIMNLKADIVTKADAIARQFVDKLNDKISHDLLMTIDLESREILNSYYNGITINKSEWNEMCYVVTLKFATTDIYKYFYGISDDDKVEPVIEKHFFYDRYVYKNKTLYYSHSSLVDSVLNYVQTNYPNLYSNEDATIYYTKVMEKRRQHSNADIIQHKTDGYYHSWVINSKEQEIEFYYNVANKGNCTLVCVVLTIVSLIVLEVVVLIKKLFVKRKCNK